MYCPQCGGTNEDPAGFCGTCGFDLNGYRRMWQDSGRQTAGQPGHVDQSPPPYPQQYQPAYQTPPYESAYQDVPGADRRVIPHIPNYLGWAIAVLILCFWPTGIAAVVYATQVDNKLIRGDIDGARESSRKAKMWCWITFGIAVGMVVLGILIAVIAVVVFGTSTISTY